MMKVMRSALCIMLSATAVTACTASAEQSRSLIADYDAAKHDSDIIRDKRWQIVIHSGAGIPGTPGAGDYYRKPMQVLQTIVDTCELGPTIYQVATDGVSVLTVMNDALSDTQVACVRSAEDTGLYLQDPRPTQ